MADTGFNPWGLALFQAARSQSVIGACRRQSRTDYERPESVHSTVEDHLSLGKRNAAVRGWPVTNRPPTNGGALHPLDLLFRLVIGLADPHRLPHFKRKGSPVALVAPLAFISNNC
jgi:hypothetical protein